MKRVLWMALLTLALPVAAFAGTVDFSAQSGTLSGSSSGLMLMGQQVNSIAGLTPSTLQGSDLAVISFNTGALTSTGTGTWTFASGGSFTITAENIPGIANGTVIFAGTFDCGNGGICTFSETNPSKTSGNHIYALNGTISGKWYNGLTVSGFTMQATVSTGLGFWDGASVPVISGDTQFTTPEPGSLMLMGTGLIGLGGVLRRKLKA